MRKYAIVHDNVVVEIEQLSDSEVISKANYCQCLIDIEDQIPEPEIGWVLQGNTLVPANTLLTNDEQDLFQQCSQRKFGLALLTRAVDKIGARNLKLTREGTPADVAALANQMAAIKLLLEGGALKTARTVCTMIKPVFLLHEDILQEVINEINSFLSTNNWN